MIRSLKKIGSYFAALADDRAAVTPRLERSTKAGR